MSMLDWIATPEDGGGVKVRILALGKEKIFPRTTMSEMQRGAEQYQAGQLIGQAFHFLNLGEREFLMTGYTQADWDAMFPPGCDE